MQRLFFISDAHLGLEGREEEARKEAKLISFLEHVGPRASELYIVGDLFDAWFEYRTVIPKGFHRLFTSLEDLVRAGVKVHYMAGNHDFWIRDFFSNELGVVTHRDPVELTSNGKRVYVHHGDGVMPGDTGYRILKKILRNRFNIWLYSWLHPDLGIPLARSTSRSSRQYTSEKDYGEQDGMLLFAASKIREGFDIVIMGHRHRPLQRQIDGGTYINLGDWITQCTYAELSADGVCLKEWNPTKP